MTPRPRSVAALLLIVFILLPSVALAHLCLIRQGLESGGQPELNNHFGTALAVGDFNGDGLDDLATGAPDDGQGFPMQGLDGALTVNYGSQYGLTHEDAQYITIGDIPDIVVRFGQSLAVGNFNNDAYEDLAVGAPDVDKLSVTDAGGVLIYMGGPLGLPTSASITFDQEDIGQVSQAGDRWGWSLTTGDFNGDGFDDLGVGAPGKSFDTGSVSAIYGSGSGLTAAGAQTFAYLDVGGGGGGAPQFGWALTSGDVTGTSHDELIASAAYAETQATQGGRVYTIPGSGTGLDAASAIEIDGTVSGKANSNLGPNEFGFSLAVGEFPHGSPNYAELVIGEPGWDEGGMESTGRVLVGSVDPGAADSSWVTLTRLNAGFNPMDQDRFGAAVAVGKYWDKVPDYVAVGAPGIDLTSSGSPVDNVGQVFLFSADEVSTGNGLLLFYDPIRLNDKEYEFNSQMAKSLAFGFFDGFGFGNLAIGSPEKNYDIWVEDQGGGIIDAGQVYVLAPWRQVQSLRSRSAIAINCEAEIVFSQRPFHRAPIASVTKTMTALLACEEMDMGYDSSAVHSAPEWLNPDNLTCTCWRFLETQQTKFIDLVRIAMGRSGNDATYAIADMLTGPLVWSGKDSTAAMFVDEMNAKAGLLGMNRTIYTNPAGYDVPHYSLGILPYSTVYDQALLAQATMQNSCLREMVATEGWTVRTFYPSGSFLNFNIDVTVDEPLTNFFQANFSDEITGAAGIKGGSTRAALRTGQYAALNTLAVGDSYVVGAAFGFLSTGDDRYEDGARLMNLALAQCADGDSVPLPPGPPEDDPVVVFTGISTCDTVVTGISASLTDAEYNPVTLTILPEAVTSYPVDLDLRMFRQTVFEISAGETVELTLNRRRSGEGWKIKNAGDELAELLILLGTPTNVNLNPGETYMIPGSASIVETNEVLPLQNVGMGTTNLIQIVANNRWLPLSIVDAGDRQDVEFGRTGTVISDDVQIYFIGKDPECTNTVSASINAGFPSTTAIDPTKLPAPEGVLPGRLLAAFPNPSSTGATIRYELSRPSSVRLAVFDLAGRHVETIVQRSDHDAGEHERVWNGRSAAGSRVPAGVYFIELDIDGIRDTRQIVILR